MKTGKNTNEIDHATGTDIYSNGILLAVYSIVF